MAKEVDDDYDFDFSIYESDDKEDATIKKERPKFSYLRSRFSLGQSVLEDIGSLRSEITKCAANIESGTQDINELKRLFGLLNEIWTQILHTQGEENFKEIVTYKEKCWKYLTEYNTKTIPREVQLYFLDYRTKIYSLLAWCNLSFDVEKSNAGSSAKRKIVE